MQDSRMQATKLGMSRVITGTFDSAINRVTEVLKANGFGILSDIDVAATLKSKIDVDMEPYRILGACNPRLAHRALGADRSIGLLLPCNVVVREVAPGSVEVSIADPETMFSLAPAEKMQGLSDLPTEARDKLKTALAELN